MSKKLTLEIVAQNSENSNIKNIISLNIPDYNLSDISILSQLKNIKTLNLKNNSISDFSQLECLKNCKQLEILELKGNPICNEQNYIQKIMEILPQLKKLDDNDLSKIKDIKISSKIEKIKNYSKFLKFNTAKSKLVNNKTNNQNQNQNSPIREKAKVNLVKNNNNEDNEIRNEFRTIKESDSSNNNDNNEENNNNNNKDNNLKENINNKENKNEEDDMLENININDEKKKMEKNEDVEKSQKNLKAKELFSYSFKKKKTKGAIYKSNRKNLQTEVIDSYENVTVDNPLNNRYNDEEQNLETESKSSKYSKKIVGMHGIQPNFMSQSIRIDDEDNGGKGFFKKKIVEPLKSKLFSKMQSQISNNDGKDNKDIDEYEQVVIKSIKLLLSNLVEEDLNIISDELNNALSKLK